MPCPSSLSAFAFDRTEVRLVLHQLEREEQKWAKTRPVLHIMEREERVKPKRACRPNNGDEGSEEGGKTRPTSHFLGRGAHYFSTYPTTAAPALGWRWVEYGSEKGLFLNGIGLKGCLVQIRVCF